MPDQPVRYHRAAMALHWLLAALLAFQFALGLRLESIAVLSDRFNAYQLHKSVGIMILLFSLVRLALRYIVPRPPAADGGAKGLAARLTHGLFYAVMIGGPLTGWAVVSTAKIKLPTVLFGIVPWPHLPLSAALLEPAELAHTILAWLLPALIALHLAGVAWHWRLKDGVAQRMVPATVAPFGAVLGGLTLLALAAVLGTVLTAPNWWRGISAPPAAAPSVAAGADQPVPIDTATPEPQATEPEPTPEPTSSETAAALSSDWQMQPGSRLGFSTSYAGTAINGSFGNWRADIHFDPANPGQARISAAIMLASARSGDAERDETLKGPSFFNAANQPTARFVASGFQRAGKDRYTAAGSLTLNGVSRPLRLTFTLVITGDKARASGTANLSRLAYGIGRDEWEATDQIPDAVGVSFTINAVRK
ncbi:MAG: YceI family protein [Novosphingobium sp.]|uniref:YceI family protein n=1 Tax=Novosphingobium sp. TaxID=1874826 RepID=UPI003C7CF141